MQNKANKANVKQAANSCLFAALIILWPLMVWLNCMSALSEQERQGSGICS